MKFPKTYKLLSNNIFSYNEYSLVPIRYEHRYEIMSWRNQQIYHLRQNKLLTKSDQDRYFKNVVSKLAMKPPISRRFFWNEVSISFANAE